MNWLKLGNELLNLFFFGGGGDAAIIATTVTVSCGNSWLAIASQSSIWLHFSSITMTIQITI